MKHLRFSLLLKALRINFILAGGISMALLWSPVRAGERCEPVDPRKAIGQVVQQNIPAVVHIEAGQSQKVVLPFDNDPFFRYFFNMRPIPGGFKRKSYELDETGTGILIDSEGHVLTSSQLAKPSAAIQVLLPDGRQYPAEVVGADPNTDLAVLRISVNEKLPHVRFGDSDEVALGDWVVAIGYPRGLAQIVTQGIIVSTHRAGMKDIYAYQDFLQTDAAINAVNTGGPLLNLCGEVIGIISTTVTKSSGFEGIGFAIPASIAARIAKQLLAHGQMARGWIGVGIQDVTPELHRSSGLERPEGALIAHIVKGGPADRAGIRKGDVVIGYEGREIPDGATLRKEVAVSPIGQEVKLTVIRNRKKQELKVRIENLQEAISRQVSSIKARLGVDVRPVTSQEAEQYRLGSRQALVITSLYPNSPLAEVGFEVNDMVLEINGRPIDSVEDFESLANALRPEQRVILLGLDHRSGRSGYVQAVVP